MPSSSLPDPSLNSQNVYPLLGIWRQGVKKEVNEVLENIGGPFSYKSLNDLSLLGRKGTVPADMENLLNS